MKVRSLGGLLAALVVLCFAHGTTIADDAVPQWPQFRGPNASGIAAESKYPNQLDLEKNVAWTTEVPSGVSSPCIWNDRIFLTAFTPQPPTLETLCIDRTTGKILWRRPAPAEQIEKVHHVSSPANATPATDGERVYVYFASFGLLCYDFEGTEVWKHPLPFSESRFGTGTSPIVADNRVILNRDIAGFSFGSGSARILAVDSHTGELAWQTLRGPSFVMYSSPVVWREGDAAQVLLAGSQRLTAYDVGTGEEQWHVAGLPPQICATPIVSGNHVYLSGTGMFGEPEAFLGVPDFDQALAEYDGNADGIISADEFPKDLVVVDRRATGGAGNSPLSLFARGVDKDQDKKIAKDEWDAFAERLSASMSASEPGLFAIRLDGKGDVTRTHVAWRETKGVAEVPSPLVVDGRVYLIRNGGIVHCRDTQSGRELFTGRLGPGGGYYASPVAADGKIYFVSDQGAVTVIAASDTLQVISQSDLGERVMATPALVDSCVYIRTDTKLIAFSNPQ